MSKRAITPISIIITSILAIVLIIIFILIAYYRSSLLHLNGVIDKDFFPAFGSFLGSTAGLIISLGSIILIYYTYQSQQEQLKITKGLVNRQIALSIKPDIVIQDFRTGEKPPKDFVSYEPGFDGLLPRDLRDLDIKILNVGVEVARYIEYHFEYDIANLISYMSSPVAAAPLNVDYDESKMFATVTRVATGFKMWINVLSPMLTQEKDYLMPYKLNKDYISDFFPQFYMMVYYHVLVSRSINGTSRDSDMDGFPPCNLHVSYSDLEGIRHKKKFTLKIAFESGVELLNPEHASNIWIKISAKEIS